jgi:CheY-like chemotaxis protein
MSQLAEILKAIGALAWPVILAVVLWKFYGPLKSVIESARGRRFTVKVAGNELTVEEANEQQRHLLSDLQTKLAGLEKRIETTLVPGGLALIGPKDVQPSATRPVRSILWVDDNPKNNSYIISTLTDLRVAVTTALSTREALRLFEPGRFARIVTDMGRPEGDKAGIDLVKLIRTQDPNIPIIIYCGGWAAANLKEEALKAGASGITSSATTLLRLLNVEDEGSGGE